MAITLTQGELQEHADTLLRTVLDPLRPLTWKKVAAALRGQKWHAQATFTDPWTQSNEYGDYIIRLPESLVGYRTYRDGIEPREEHISFEEVP
jgi:hypothetical protein